MTEPEPAREPDALDVWIRDYSGGVVERAIRQRFLALGAAVANLEARVRELEEARRVELAERAEFLADLSEIGAGPLEPDKIATTDAPGG